MATVLYGGDTTEERRLAVEDRIGADRVVQLFDRDGDGVVEGSDVERFERYLAQADDIVTGLLIKKGWTEQQLRESIRHDRQVINAWTGIFAQIAGELKSEWIDAQGKGLFDAYGTRARAELAALARGEIRSHREGGEGGTPNANIAGNMGNYPFEFAPDPFVDGDRGKGGF